MANQPQTPGACTTYYEKLKAGARSKHCSLDLWCVYRYKQQQGRRSQQAPLLKLLSGVCTTTARNKQADARSKHTFSDFFLVCIALQLSNKKKTKLAANHTFRLEFMTSRGSRKR